MDEDGVVLEFCNSCKILLGRQGELPWTECQNCGDEIEKEKLLRGKFSPADAEKMMIMD